MTPIAPSGIGADGIRALGNHQWQSTAVAGIAALFAVALRKYCRQNKLLPSAVVFAAMTAPTAFGIAQSAMQSADTPATSSRRSSSTAPAEPSQKDVLGTWQGTMRAPGGHDQRVVLKIAKDGKGGLSSMLYNLDQSGPPVAATSVSFANGSLRFVYDFPGITYRGKLSADGKQIRGTLTPTMHPTPIPLVLEGATPETEWAIPAPPAAVQTMAPDAKPDVEVSTVKPTRPGTRMFMLVIRGPNVVAQNLTLAFLIRFAYQVQSQQVVGAPSWMDSDRWDIQVKPDVPGKPSVKQMREILQKLFAQRFALKFHKETREMTGYVLTVDKNGPKITKSADPSLPPNSYMQPLGVLHVEHATMGDFTRALRQNLLDRPVVDKTGLTGKWDFVLHFDWTPFAAQFPEMPAHPQTASDSSAPSLFTAVQQQLGLRLKAQKAQVPVLVIDHVERPSPN